MLQHTCINTRKHTHTPSQTHHTSAKSGRTHSTHKSCLIMYTCEHGISIQTVQIANYAHTPDGWSTHITHGNSRKHIHHMTIYIQKHTHTHSHTTNTHTWYSFCERIKTRAVSARCLPMITFTLYRCWKERSMILFFSPSLSFCSMSNYWTMCF